MMLRQALSMFIASATMLLSVVCSYARPAAWCGWYMRQIVNHDPGPDYNLARNWAHWGREVKAGVGAIVVWPHHVGRIVGASFDQRSGETRWVVLSGNWANRIHAGPMSIKGAIAIRGF